MIRINRGGNAVIDGAQSDEPLSTEGLHTRLREEAARNPGRQVRIDGDANAAYQSVVRVLDQCQFEGLTNISMHTRQP